MSRKRGRKNARNKPKWRFAIKVHQYLREATSWAANQNPSKKKESKVPSPISIPS